MKPSWITSDTDGQTGNGSFSLTASKNDNVYFQGRNGIVTIDGGGIKRTIIVDQKGGNYYHIKDYSSAFYNQLKDAKCKSGTTFELWQTKDDKTTPLWCEFYQDIISIEEHPKFYLDAAYPKRIYMRNTEYPEVADWKTVFTYRDTELNREGTGGISFYVKFSKDYYGKVSNVTSIRTINSIVPNKNTDINANPYTLTIDLAKLSSIPTEFEVLIEMINIEFINCTVVNKAMTTIKDSSNQSWECSAIGSRNAVNLKTTRTTAANAATLNYSIQITDKVPTTKTINIVIKLA